MKACTKCKEIKPLEDYHKLSRAKDGKQSRCKVCMIADALQWGNMMSSRKPVAVIISDVHYSLKTLELADAAMHQAINRAAELRVPLIIAGDLHDTKAAMRGECVNALIQTFSMANRNGVIPRVLIGNHDMLNEKGEGHSLNFLRRYAEIIDAPKLDDTSGSYFIPYQNDPTKYPGILADIPKGSTLIVHQGIKGSDPGEYTHDKTAVDKELFADYRTISGHYHRAQDIKAGRPRKGAVGLFSYVGSGYTVTYGEAEDGKKGFQVLYDDGLMELVPTNLRRHIIITGEWSGQHQDFQYNIPLSTHPNPDDLVWVKVTATKRQLDGLNKKALGSWLGIGENFKLDKIPTDSDTKVKAAEIEKKTHSELLDGIIDGSAESAEEKAALKALYRELT
jgi:hypothetical protein